MSIGTNQADLKTKGEREWHNPERERPPLIAVAQEVRQAGIAPVLKTGGVDAGITGSDSDSIHFTIDLQARGNAPRECSGDLGEHDVLF
tara:strand:- start:28646 stop:28912 length:267 start_codon:yes stop_codon:yes gene_type:complete